MISKRNSVNRETRGPPHITGRTSHAQVRYDMQQKGEPTDKMTVWLKARNQNDADVIQARMDYQEALDKEPEDQRQLTSVKDRIFHELIGQDGHGYCRTYGSSVPRSLVYPQNPTSPHVSTSELMENINKEVTRRLTEVTEQFDLQILELSKKYDEVISQLRQMSCSGERTSVPNAPVQDASSGHHRESVGDGMNLLVADKDLLLIDDDEEEDLT